MEGEYLSGDYLYVSGKGFVHVLTYEAAHGSVPEGYVIDHINRIKTDNRLENLRAVPRGFNAANTDPQRELPKGVFKRFAARLNREVFYGDVRINGHKETYPPTPNKQAVIEWAEATRNRLLMDTYGMTC